MLAGPPGAGKSKAKNGLLTTDAERATYLRVDADDFKKLLLGRAIEDGSYDSWLKPAEIKRLEAQGQQFFPMELASLVHEESSLIAMGLRVESIRQGTNLVIDGVLASEEKAVRLGDELEAAGYEVRVVDVEVPSRSPRTGSVIRLPAAPG